MSSEIEISETPNWLSELEAKREKRLKAKLGHEAGAGAPCLKCGDKCPGLDLHFWRKCCKICRCSKEEHEVQDDDIYGWAQFQLLGNKPNKIKKKIVLPGKQDELELDWVPKGPNDVVEKYLKTLPPEQLPVKGSQAAQDRKQLLQKQIPIHDIDPMLCHELTDDELNKMNEYIAHVKKNCVGVGQIVNLSLIIKGNLHVLNPSDAALIASRYPKGVPISEIVKLQSMGRVDPLKPHGLIQNMQGLSVKEKSLQNLSPNNSIYREETMSPMALSKIHDKNYAGYTNEMNKGPLHPQFSNKLNTNNKPVNKDSNLENYSYEGEMDKIHERVGSANLDNQYHQNPPLFSISKITSNNSDNDSKLSNDSDWIDKLRQNSKFNSKNLPSQFINQHMPQVQNTSGQMLNQNSYETNVPYSDMPKGLSYTGNTLAPYNKTNTNLKVGGQFSTENTSLTPNYCTTFSNPGNTGVHSHPTPSFTKDEWERTNQLGSRSQEIPNYIPGKYNQISEFQSPTHIPRNVRDLAFGTYEPKSLSDPQDLDNNDKIKYNVSQETRHQSGLQNTSTPLGILSDIPNQKLNRQSAYDPNQSSVLSEANPQRLLENIQTIPGMYESENLNNAQNHLLTQQKRLDSSTSKGIPALYEREYYNKMPNKSINPESGYGAKQSADLPETLHQHDLKFSPTTKSPGVYDPKQSSVLPGMYPESELSKSSIPRHNSAGMRPEPQDQQKLSHLQPGTLSITEDFLEPSQVSIGSIQDINYPEIKAALHGTNDFYEDYSPDSIKEILNNIKLPDCHYCKKPFEEKEFAVTIERANVLFHADCFRCAGCNQILADNFYFYNKENNNIYCGRDYAKIRGFPRCKACDELIFTKEYCLAEDNTFHLKHFCCTECDTPLAGQDYTVDDSGGMPYCLPCFERSKADSCSSCNRIIKPDEMGCNLNGVHFHADDQCFACKICLKPLMGKKMLLRNKKLYCSHECYGTEQ